MWIEYEELINLINSFGAYFNYLPDTWKNTAKYDIISNTNKILRKENLHSIFIDNKIYFCNNSEE